MAVNQVSLLDIGTAAKLVVLGLAKRMSPILFKHVLRMEPHLLIRTSNLCVLVVLPTCATISSHGMSVQHLPMDLLLHTYEYDKEKRSRKHPIISFSMMLCLFRVKEKANGAVHVTH